jgi:hypothetical protein
MKVPAAAAVALFKIVCFFICGYQCKPPKPKAGSNEADFDPRVSLPLPRKKINFLTTLTTS